MLLTAFVLAALLATAPPAAGRTLTDLKVIPLRVLQRSISPKFYKSLLISPIEGLVVVRGSLSGARLSGAKVVQSQLDGAFDSLALKLADEIVLAGNYSIERPNVGSTVLLHLLLYKIADGTMALSFAHVADPGGDQAQYFGCARLAVLKNDGQWVEIKGPESLQGKGWSMRRGVKNDLELALKMEVKRPGPGAK